MMPAEFFGHAYPEAIRSQHIWPEFACCEAALESAWGTSKAATLCNDLFGQKAGFSTTEYPIVEIPTHEWIDGKNVPMMAKWPKFPDWATAFSERMELLRRKVVYLPALTAITGERFIRLVSATWATDPLRGDKVMQIYRAHWPKDFPEVNTLVYDPEITT